MELWEVVWLETIFSIPTSPSGVTFVVALSKLLSGFGSGVVEFIVALFVMELPEIVTLVVIINVCISPTAISPMVHFPVSLS